MAEHDEDGSELLARLEKLAGRGLTGVSRRLRRAVGLADLEKTLERNSSLNDERPLDPRARIMGLDEDGLSPRVQRALGRSS